MEFSTRANFKMEIWVGIPIFNLFKQKQTMKTTERLQTLMDYLHIGPGTLAKEAGLTKGRIIDMMRYDAKAMPYDVAAAVVRKFPSINKEWLLTGEGEMLNLQLADSGQTPPPEGIKKVNEPLDSIQREVKRLADLQAQLLAELVSQRQLILQLMEKDSHHSAPAHYEPFAAESTEPNKK